MKWLGQYGCCGPNGIIVHSFIWRRLLAGPNREGVLLRDGVEISLVVGPRCFSMLTPKRSLISFS